MGDNLSRTKRSSQAIDNFSFDEDFLVKMTELVRRNQAGDAIETFNPATEEKQDALAGYAKAGQDISGDPMYFAGLKADGKWYIKKMYLSGDYTSKYANGTSGFDWSTRASLSYVDFNALTW